MPENTFSEHALRPNAQPAEVHLLVVDDDRAFLSLMVSGLRAEGYQVTTATSLSEAAALFEPGKFSLVLLDLLLPEGEALGLLREMIKADPDQPVVVISGYGTIPQAVEAIKAGARDFLEKPLGLERILLTVRNTLENVILQQEATRLRYDLDALIEAARQRYQMLGVSPVMKQAFVLIDRYAPLNTFVLITGETGVGKELAAHAIHLNSRRASRKFITINCSNISDELLESELFGHVKGAFTGAHADKLGLFQAANGGTLFLDEIGDLSLRAQAKVLHAIEYGEVTRVGEVNSEKVDVRLIAATNRDLLKLADEGKYREDLYYRINVMRLHLPPLREHPEDIPLLAQYFLDKFCQENELPPKKLTPDAEVALRTQPWKGNVRELLHFMGRLAVFANGHTISSALIWQALHFDQPPMPQGIESATVPSLHEARESFEREYILAALQKHHNNFTQTAVVLGIERSQLYRKMEKLGIKTNGNRHAIGAVAKS